MLVSPAIVNAQGCMEPSSDAGASLIGFIQPQFESYMNGVNLNGNPIMIDGKETPNYNSFSFMRARLGVTGNIPYDINYYVMAEFSNFKNGPYLLDAFVTYTRLGPWAKFSLGQFKAPVSLELQNPCHKLHTVYRSLVVQQLVAPWRDIGFMVSGGVSLKNYAGLTDHNFLSYQLAIMNGTGINTWDNNNYKDIAGRLLFHVWDGIDIGGSFRSGSQNPYDETINGGKGQNSVYGAEISVDYFNFLLQAEYLYGVGKNIEEIAAGGCGGGGVPAIRGTLERNGYYAMLLYRTPWGLEPVVKYEFFNPAAEVTDYTLFASEPNETITSLTLGLNYFINDWSRVQVNYIIHDDGNVYTDANTPTNSYNNSPHAISNPNIQFNENFYKQQFVIQFQAVLQ